MSQPLPSWVITVLLQDDALTLNRAVGIVRRRNLALTSLSLGAAGQLGVSRMTCFMVADQAAIDRTANQLRKMVGAHAVTVSPEAECVTREHALIRVRVQPAGLASLLDTVALFQANVVEEGASEVVLEATATPPLLNALLRALEPHGVLEVARGGPVALARPSIPEASHCVATSPGIATAIPA